MPHFAPFAGLRPQPSVTGPLEDVVCPPYDVITEEQRQALLERSPYNTVRVELPNGDYQQAATTLAKWRQDRAFAVETEPAIYGYRMSYDAPNGERRHTLGVLGALTLEPPGNGILPHEQTTPKAKSDRLELIRATKANTSPIWCLCTKAGLIAALGPLPTSSTTLSSARDDDGTVHEIWPITDPTVQTEVAKLLGAAPVLVADGHHRYETALTYQAEQGPGTGADAVLALIVELSEEHLAVMAIHRSVSGLPPGFDLAETLAEHFVMSPTELSGRDLLDEMVTMGGLAVLTAAGTWFAAPRPGGLASTQALDSSRIDTVLATLPPHDLSYEHDTAQAESDVRAGRVDAVIFCRPATVAQIAGTAAGGERMPPKTTFFWPKPRTGLVFRLL